MLSQKPIKIQKLLIRNFNEPVNVYYIIWLKIIIGTLYLWKLLSRDFSNISYWPESVLAGYPVDIYPPDFLLTTGVSPFFDIVTFHFIHYFCPFPTLNILQVIQFAAIILSFLIIITPPRFARSVGMILYVVVAYLWGFVFRLGQEIDAVFLLQGSLLVYCLVPYNESVEYFRKIRFLVLCIFVIYYFFSGLNKVIDLSYSEWFNFDLRNINNSANTRYIFEHAQWVPKIPLVDNYFINGLIFISPAITYLVHLCAPVLLISSSTKKILLYYFFYSSFHFSTLFVGILFTMNFFAWLLVLPVYKWVGHVER